MQETKTPKFLLSELLSRAQVKAWDPPKQLESGCNALIAWSVWDGN
jgi:hypothetical protein